MSREKSPFNTSRESLKGEIRNTDVIKIYIANLGIFLTVDKYDLVENETKHTAQLIEKYFLKKLDLFLIPFYLSCTLNHRELNLLFRSFVYSFFYFADAVSLFVRDSHTWLLS